MDAKQIAGMGRCGNTGKIDNCVISVHVSYVVGDGGAQVAVDMLGHDQCPLLLLENWAEYVKPVVNTWRSV